MKKFLKLVPLLLLCACSPAPSNSELDQWRGQWLVINYWAQWCKPCIKEIPELNELHLTEETITVVGVNFDGATGEALAEQIEQLGIEFPTLAQDPAALLGTPRPAALPTSLILNPQGNVVATLLGPQTLASLRGAISKALANQQN